MPWFERLLLTGQDDPLRLLVAVLLAEDAVRGAAELHRRQVDEELQRLMDEDTDGVLAVMRRMDLPPTLAWALLGATVLMAPWCFVIGLADVLGRASQEAVVTAWAQTLPAAAAVFALELLTAAYIGPPAYHPRLSLAGLLIRSAERPARLTLSRRYVTVLLGAAVVAGAVLLGFTALAVAPWVWPLASVVALAAWSVRRCLVWRRRRRARAARRLGCGAAGSPPGRSRGADGPRCPRRTAHPDGSGRTAPRARTRPGGHGAKNPAGPARERRAGRHGPARALPSPGANAAVSGGAERLRRAGGGRGGEDGGGGGGGVQVNDATGDRT